MEIRPAAPSHLPVVRDLLAAAGLPDGGLPEQLEGFVVATDGDQVVGCAGMEVYGACGLLRSVAVRPDRRRRGVGRALVARLIARARAAGVAAIYLLTTDAVDYFARLGFEPLDRDQVPPEVRRSARFSAECCAAARAMRLGLREREETP
ncbi:MAG: arsenic resistance N-acetyltransferase ArsN2 [Armatimonadota bacterium]|nr:arsenic resistance N-acetyltransferase ArsN2 [Armatimonadota bacterium]MDR7402812.1 arsenic resistance N-acetyltransferase ArsN2 [Armatimonadota bacterium]MDR7405013.1 arsenic resistance N-acetyltransferase ArsN2 [Armatimonadota bacterium]MDR7436150.1 arsenic resistance N-acetyltransferase ArsN2 [Armatimonadota bacterium]MDR7472029.1 arsenic resistance N-acetyltransferase ArsN2 [Armatimonadota bacterium]